MFWAVWALVGLARELHALATRRPEHTLSQAVRPLVTPAARRIPCLLAWALFAGWFANHIWGLLPRRVRASMDPWSTSAPAAGGSSSAAHAASAAGSW